MWQFEVGTRIDEVFWSVLCRIRFVTWFANVFWKFNQHGCKSRRDVSSPIIWQHPPQYISWKWKIPHTNQFHPPNIEKWSILLNRPPNIQKWSIMLNHPPKLNIDLHPCQSSVILVTFFQILFYKLENFVYSSAYHNLKPLALRSAILELLALRIVSKCKYIVNQCSSASRRGTSLNTCNWA